MNPTIYIVAWLTITILLAALARINKIPIWVAITSMVCMLIYFGKENNVEEKE